MGFMEDAGGFDEMVGTMGLNRQGRGGSSSVIAVGDDENGENVV